MKPAVFHPEPSQEYLRALAYHLGISADLANRFDAEIQRLVAEISQDPQRFYRFDPPAKQALSRRFPFSVVYLEQADRVWIVAAMHAKRQPGYWAKRLH